MVLPLLLVLVLLLLLMPRVVALAPSSHQDVCAWL